MRFSSTRRAFTLMEMLMTMFSMGMLGTALLLFSTSSSRFVARNLATNHSHDTARISEQSLLKDLHDSASVFNQFNFDGTSYTDFTPAATADVDVLTGRVAGTRSNGVRFRQLIAGPLT